MTTVPLEPTVAIVDKVGVRELSRAGLEEPPDTIIGGKYECGSLVAFGVARAANAFAVSGGSVADCGTTRPEGGGGGTEEEEEENDISLLV